jgi:hypothetical protein
MNMAPTFVKIFRVKSKASAMIAATNETKRTKSNKPSGARRITLFSSQPPSLSHNNATAIRLLINGHFAGKMAGTSNAICVIGVDTFEKKH